MKTSELLAGHSERVAEAAQKPSTAIPTATIKAYNMGNFKPAADVAHQAIRGVVALLPHRTLCRRHARGCSGKSWADVLVPFDEVTPVTHSLDEQEDKGGHEFTK